MISKFFVDDLCWGSFLLDGLRGFGKTFDLQPFGGLEKSGQLVLGHVDLSSVHEFQDCSEVLKQKQINMLCEAKNATLNGLN